MSKKNEKRLCWNCEGNVSMHHSLCPYCGVDLTKPRYSEKTHSEDKMPFASPFQESYQEKENLGSPFQTNYPDSGIPQPPYGDLQGYSVSDEEWNQALEEEEENEEGDSARTTKGEMIALLLLLPGIVFCLFGLILLLFSQDGILSLQWNQSFAYFYFLGAIPLLFLGWRALR